MTTNQPELHPKIVLAVAAHADDIDFCMAGTIAKWAAEGAEIYYLILTGGDRGSSDTSVKPKQLIKTRQAEQREAAQLLGVKEVIFCKYKDCQLKCDQDVTRDIVRAIRHLKPDTVMTIDPSLLYNAETGYINHPDHRAAGQATLDAVYPMARDHLSFPELLRKEHLAPHKVRHILLWNFDSCNYSVDISNYLAKKQAAMAAHTSQVKDVTAVKTVIEDHAKLFGAKVGLKYAESFVLINVRF